MPATIRQRRRSADRRHRLPIPRTVLATLGVTTVAALAAACGSDGTDTAQDPSIATDGTVHVTLTADGCRADHDGAEAGPVTFTAKNDGAVSVTELQLRDAQGRVLGEKENLAPGLSGTFSLKLDAGKYQLYCPGAAHEHTDFTVTGSSTTTGPSGDTAQQLQHGAEQYSSYVREQVGHLRDAVGPLVAAVHGGDLDGAQRAYAQARTYYERIEPVAESFTIGADSLDQDLDAREGDVPAQQWTGFHRLEKGLFEAETTQGLDGYADGLARNVDKLVGLVDRAPAYTPDQIVMGAGGLLDEVSNTKIHGEEERYSHIDMVDLSANIAGAEQAFAAIEPALRELDAPLAETISDRFAALDALVAKQRDPQALGGYRPFDRVGEADRRAIAEAVTAVKDPLANAGGKIAAAS